MGLTPATIIQAYLGFINIAAMAVFGIDKAKARRGSRRISEASLFFISLIGGAIGGLVGMIMFHHKTRKIGFKVVMFFIILINFYLYYWLYINMLGH